MSRQCVNIEGRSKFPSLTKKIYGGLEVRYMGGLDLSKVRNRSNQVERVEKKILGEITGIGGHLVVQYKL